MVYPAVVVSVAVLVVGVLMVFVVPQFEAIFREMASTEMPPYGLHSLS